MAKMSDTFKTPATLNCETQYAEKHVNYRKYRKHKKYKSCGKWNQCKN